MRVGLVVPGFSADAQEKSVAHKTEGFIARRVSEGVVVAFEVIEVEHHNG